MTILRKLSAIAAVVLLACLTLSACGDKDDAAGDKPDSTSSDGGGKTAALTQANFSQVLADSQVKAKSAHVEMKVSVGGQALKAHGDVKVGKSLADGAMALSMDMGSAMKVDMRMVDQVMYMNMGQMTEGKFLKIDLTDDSNPFAKQFGGIMEQLDPATQMAQFKDALTSFQKKGEPQTIDGVKAQPYVVTVDTSKLEALKDLPGGAAGQIPDTIVYTMYVGPDDLLRRMEFDIAGSEMTMDYSKWGEPVDIKAPPAGDISDKDFSDLGGMPTPAA